jgi:selenium-binding protein 1
MSQMLDPTFYRSPADAIAAPLERRYLIVLGLRAARGCVLDTKPDPHTPQVVRAITAEELAAKAGHARPTPATAAPGGIFVSALGGAGGNDGPGRDRAAGPRHRRRARRLETDRGDVAFADHLWWHLDHDTLSTSGWGTPSMVEHGLDPGDLLGRRFGHHLNCWSMSQRTLTQRVDLGDQPQTVLELRPGHDPADALAPLLLLGSGGVPLLVAISRARLAAARARLTRARSRP